MDLYAILRALPLARGRFALDVPDGLQQGRGAWGAVATGAMTSAALQTEQRFPVRTLSAQLVAPLLVGRHDIVVEELRGGSSTTTLGLRVADADGRLVAHGVVVLGAARAPDAIPDGVLLSPPAELAAGPDAVPAVPLGPPLAPRFTEQLEFRPITGLPFTGSPVAVGWVRPKDPVSGLDAAVVVAMADAWWITAMAQVVRPRPVGTLGFTVDLPADPASLPRTTGGRLLPLLHRGRTLAVCQGFTLEARELWTSDGRLAAYNTQTVAIIA